jgi:hypothetical protein
MFKKTALTAKIIQLKTVITFIFKTSITPQELATFKRKIFIMLLAKHCHFIGLF